LKCQSKNDYVHDNKRKHDRAHKPAAFPGLTDDSVWLGHRGNPVCLQVIWFTQHKCSLTLWHFADYLINLFLYFISTIPGNFGDHA